MKPSLVVAGLGNPGSAYVSTRHNAGFRGVDVLSAAYATGPWKHSGKFDAEVQEARIFTVPVLLMKPRTFMNLSGQSIGAVLDFYKIPASQGLLVLSDDVDLPLGTLRLRRSGSAGTHNGLKSVVERFGENFARLKIGIGPKPDGADLATWVLSTPQSADLAAIDKACADIPDIVKEFILGSDGAAGAAL